MFNIPINFDFLGGIVFHAFWMVGAELIFKRKITFADNFMLGIVGIIVFILYVIFG